MSQSLCFFIAVRLVLEHGLCFNSVWPSSCFVLQLFWSLIFPWVLVHRSLSRTPVLFYSLLLAPVSAHQTFLSLAVLHEFFERVPWFLFFFLLWLIYISVSVDWPINLNSYVLFPSVNKGKSILLAHGTKCSILHAIKILFF